MRFRRTVATLVATASLGVGAIALAPTAGAQTEPSTPKGQACDRAHDAWQKLVAANQRAVDEYHRLRAKQQELLANGHDAAAHRLDARLDAARRHHEQVVAKVLAIAERVKNVCSEQPPVLASP